MRTAEAEQGKKDLHQKGRHPLLDSKTVVPIDLWVVMSSRHWSSQDRTRSKTVSLKTVGLFTLMAQAGLHIPAAEGTEMGILTIFLRI